LSASIVETRITARTSISLLLLILALSIPWFTIGRIDLTRTGAYDLAPWPDGYEYFSGAVSLVRSGSYSLPFAGQQLPPRYPFGYSVLQAATMELGAEPIAAPFIVNLLAVYALVAGVFLGMLCLGEMLGGAVAALTVATLPAVIVLGRSPLSEVSSMAVVLTGFFLLVLGSRRQQSTGLAMLGAILLGLSVCFRLNNCLFGLVFLWVPLMGADSRKQRFRRLLKLGVGFLLGASPALLYNAWTFGSPLMTGYHIWVGRWDSLDWLFNIRNVPGNLEVLAGELTRSPAGYHVSDLYGTGTYFGPAFAALAVAGLLFAWRSRVFRPFAAGALLFAAVMAFYYLHDPRMFFPSLVLLAPPIGHAFERIVDYCWREAGRLRRLPAGLAGLFLLSAVVGVPGQDGSATLSTLLNVDRLERPARRYQAARGLDETPGSDDALILTDLPPPYVKAVVDGKRVVAPATFRHPYNVDPRFFHFGQEEIEYAIRETLARKGSVILLLGLDEDASPSVLRVPPDGFGWARQRHASLYGAYWRLVPQSATASTVSVAETSEARCVFPYLALGGGLDATLALVNRTPDFLDGNIVLRVEDQRPWPGFRAVEGSRKTDPSTFHFRLAGRERRTFALQTLEQRLRVGYLEIETDQPPALEAMLNLRISSGPRRFELELQPSPSATRFLFEVERGPGVNTSLAWLPMTHRQEPIEISFSLLDETGSLVASKRVRSQGHHALFFSELFGGAGDAIFSKAEFRGVVQVSAHEPVYLTALRQESVSPGGSKITPLPTNPH
jgi:hypothetical protein